MDLEDVYALEGNLLPARGTWRLQHSKCLLASARHCIELLIWGHVSPFSILVLQFLREKVSYCISALVTSPGLRNVFILFQSSCLMDVLRLKTRQGLQEEVFSYIRPTDVPGKTGQCLGTQALCEARSRSRPLQILLQQWFTSLGWARLLWLWSRKSPDSLILHFFTCWFTIWLYCGASQLDPWVRNWCSLSVE